MTSFSTMINLIIMTMILISSSLGNYKNPMKKWPELRRIRSVHVPPDVQAQAVKDMLARLLPASQSSNFIIVVNSSLVENDRDVFIINNDADGSRIQIQGNTGVTAAWGFQYYANIFCGCHFSWSGIQVGTMPDELPRVDSPIKIVANDLFRYYQNVCSVSYSSVWWNFTRWEQEIDWMALNGINLPLAFTGQEEIFRRVYLSLGFNQQDLDKFFTGPGFLAWNRMGNVDGWGGLLPENWYQEQVALQHLILDRMRSFGMIPVLPAFSGHVPQSIEKYYPNVTVTRLSDWGHFNSTYCCTYLLDYRDPLFQTIGQNFVRELQSEFGVDHVYNCDTFNEMPPSMANVDYINGVGSAIFEAMTSVDPDAVWLMQGWLFLESFWNTTMAKALLTSVPIGRMIILDLQSELQPQYQRLDSYYGQPWIWCMLHNFGGVKGLYGAMDNVNNGPFRGRAFQNSTMIGTGITPEGIEQNDVVYELINQMAYLRSPVNFTIWLQDYSTRRYGALDPDAVAAWITLSSTVYNCTMFTEFHGAYIITVRPAFGLDSYLCYVPQNFIPAWDRFIQASNGSIVSESDLFQHDLVDITREALIVISSLIYSSMTDAYNANNISVFQDSSEQILDLLHDLDTLLASDRRFLLGRWIESAKSIGNGSSSDEALYEYNAKNQITLWGPSGEVLDYATKQWSGIVDDYYVPRWQLFISQVLQSLNMGIAFDQDTFNQNVLQEIESPFTFANKEYPTEASGNPNLIAQQLHKKWRPYLA